MAAYNTRIIQNRVSPNIMIYNRKEIALYGFDKKEAKGFDLKIRHKKRV